MSSVILFMCPHNAAKSVLAMAYFRDRVAKFGLEFVADSTGTDPDDAVLPAVVEIIQSDGISVPEERPRKVTETDLRRASIIISLGCDLADAPTDCVVQTWDDVPLPSQDLVASRDAIRNHVDALIGDLRRQ